MPAAELANNGRGNRCHTQPERLINVCSGRRRDEHEPRPETVRPELTPTLRIVTHIGNSHVADHRQIRRYNWFTASANGCVAIFERTTIERQQQVSIVCHRAVLFEHPLYKLAEFVIYPSKLTSHCNTQLCFFLLYHRHRAILFWYPA